MKFAHFADIHIRNTVRHKEYLTVFERIGTVLREQKVDRIVISGDLFHSKTVLSPESVTISKQILLGFASIAPVDIVLGNHDLNVTNEDRVDAVSAILAELREAKYPITLYRESGLHDIDDGFHYGVFSILDENKPENFPTSPSDDGINIALYHGQVDKSQSSLGFVLESGISIDLFDGYDFGFLGDIHRPQGFVKKTHWVEEDIDESMLEEYKSKHPDLEII
jgi:DNA repair exonuclease SbcCD nuclease subunit